MSGLSYNDPNSFFPLTYEPDTHDLSDPYNDHELEPTPIDLQTYYTEDNINSDRAKTYTYPPRIYNGQLQYVYPVPGHTYYAEDGTNFNNAPYPSYQPSNPSNSQADMQFMDEQSTYLASANPGSNLLPASSYTAAAGVDHQLSSPPAPSPWSVGPLVHADDQQSTGATMNPGRRSYSKDGPYPPEQQKILNSFKGRTLNEEEKRIRRAIYATREGQKNTPETRQTRTDKRHAKEEREEADRQRIRDEIASRA